MPYLGWKRQNINSFRMVSFAIFSDEIEVQVLYRKPDFGAAIKSQPSVKAVHIRKFEICRHVVTSPGSAYGEQNNAK